jgi:hypothetical protein
MIDDVEKGLQRASSTYLEMTAFRAAVAAIPVIGGPLDILLSGKAGEYQEQRFQMFLDFLTEDIETLDKKKIDKEYLSSEEFYSHFQLLAERVLREHSEDKIHLLAKALLGSITLNVASEMKDKYLSIIADLSEVDVKVLVMMLDQHAKSTVSGVGNDRGKMTEGELIQNIPKMTAGLMSAVCRTLERWGLVTDAEVGTLNYKSGSWIPTQTSFELADFISKSCGQTALEKDSEEGRE